ncbi:hypothetical protein [Shewanella aestuarii]|uniref:Uncharacterized protein n=1 Tax=Shewanella aestuarii TaxID=1028752 RepID=A0A6G9QHZ3_9GAMM|nr:hypothetical protein [Shewanella aestuarii]QIR13499.1 hypothetical protein HBH39_02435 [Shewanella aestuarii]
MHLISEFSIKQSVKIALICMLFLIHINVIAKPLLIPGVEGGTTLPVTLLEEVVKRSDVYDSITFAYGSRGIPVLVKQ